MGVSSTSTLLDVCNAALGNVNEPTITTLNTQRGLQLKSAVRTALMQMSQDNDWIWLSDTINFASWTGNIATLPSNVSRIRGVSWLGTSTGGYVPITCTTIQEFDQRPLVTSTTNARPLQWALYDHNRVKFNPYPTSTADKAKIFAYVQYILSIPTSDNGVFTMPEECVELLKLLVSGLYAARHMEDVALTQLYMQEYAASLQSMRSRHQMVPSQMMNLYKGYRKTR